MLLGSLLLAACGDVVTDRYDTLQDARNDQLFERGWLPDVLPPSAHDIRVTNNLDLDFSDGEFHFAPPEFGAFLERVSPHDGRNTPRGLRSEVEAHARSGHPVLEYVHAGSIWLFLCVPERGVCEYVQRLRD